MKQKKILTVGTSKIRGYSVTVKKKELTVKTRQSQEVCLRQDKLEFAQGLTERATKSELVLREAMLKRGYVFEFQAVVLGYIPDFYFQERNWIVELDGKRFHNKARDAKRDKDFLKFGIQTLRISSSRVFSNLQKVLAQIARTVYGSQVVAKKKSGKHQRVGKRRPTKYPYEKGLRYEKTTRR